MRIYRHLRSVCVPFLFILAINFLQVASAEAYSPLPMAGRSASAEVINGIFYVAGGFNGANETVTLQSYSPTTDIWSTLASMPEGRYEGNGAAVINGQLYVAGGWDNTYSWLPHNNLWVYDPASNNWTSKASMPILSACGASGAVGGKLYITTACDGYSGYKNFLHMFDPAIDTWSTLAPSPTAHCNPAFGVIDGKFYVAGGINSSGASSAQLDVYDPASNSWSTKTPMPITGSGFSSGAIAGMLYVTGGTDGSGAFYNTVYRYDPTTDIWSTAGSLATARTSAAAGTVNNVLYVAGGRNESGLLSTVETYSVTAQSGISGRVTNNLGAGISGVLVTVFNSANLVEIKKVTTDASGYYSVDGLALGSYKILFYAQDAGYDNTWYSSRSNSLSADTIIVGTTTYTANAILTGGVGGSISGRVTDTVGNGIPGVVLAATGGGVSPFFVFGTSTDNGGNYTINGLSSGPYKIEFQGGNVGYQNIWYDGALSSDTAAVITVSQPSSINGINATLALAGGMSGRVTNQAGNGLANVDVVLSDPITNLWLARSTTDSSGNYAVTGLLGRDYKVRFDGSTIDYGRQWYNAKGDFAGAISVTVTPPSITTGIDAVLPIGGTLSGRVTNGTAAIDGVTVTVKDAVSGDWIVNDKSDGTGAYLIRGLNSGSYKVQYMKSGYLNKWYNGKASESAADPVSVTAPAITTLADVTLSVSTAIAITGTVTDSTGAAISAATIEMSGNPVTFTTSSADGTFTLPGLPTGTTFSLKISKAGYVPAYSRKFKLTSDLPYPLPFTLFTAEETASWGGVPGKGYIRGLALDSTNRDSGYLINAVVTASSVLHPETPYPVVYYDGTTFGGSATFGNGLFIVRNIDDGDTVTVTANRSGFAFSDIEFTTHGDGVSETKAVGTSSTPGDFPIASTTEREIGFSGAFDGNNYLVGILGDTASKNNITAQMVSPSGSLVGSRITVGRTGGIPLVAFDGTNYLLVWHDDATSTFTIYGQLISLSGDKIGTPFQISEAIGTLRGGKVLFDGHNYFVTWERRSDPTKGSTADIIGQFIAKNGALLGQQLTISNAPYGQRDPTMAFDGTNILAVWVDGRNQSACYSDLSGTLCPESDIYGQIISGSSESAPGALSGNNIPLSQSSLPRDNPVGIAFDGINYLITFHELNAIPNACPVEGCKWNIYGQLVSPAGGPTGSRITISNAPENQSFPFPAFDGTNYLITWTDGLGGQLSQVTSKGRFMDRSGEFTSPEFVLFSAAADGRIPYMTTAGGRPGGGYTVLVGWGTPGANHNDFSGYTNADVYWAFINRSILEITTINGSCGSSGGQTFTSQPTSNLCATGTATPVTGNGSWTWSCQGASGGTDTSCSATVGYNMLFESGGNGTLVGTTLQTVGHGGSTTAVSATPNTGYHFINWTGTGGFVTSTSNPLKIDNVTASQTITANFAPDSINGTCGSSDSQPFFSPPTTNLCATGTASPVTDTGSWTWSWNCQGINGGTNANCSATMLSYNIKFESGGNGTLVGKTNQTIAYGGSTTAVTATPNTGYRFINWSSTGGFVSTSSNPLTIDNVTVSMTITANFGSFNTWQETGGPAVGPFRSMAIDPTSTQTIYTGTMNYGIFKSINGGSSWSEVNSGLTSMDVRSLVIDPTSSQNIYAGTMDGGVFKSTNGGISWITASSGLAVMDVYTLVIDPANSLNIYVGTSGGGVFKTANGGISWISVNSGITDMDIVSMVIDKSSPQTIYAGSLNSGVFKTTNGGYSWSAVNSGLPSTPIFSLVIDPTNSQFIYVGTYGSGVFKSTNSGDSWSAVNSGLNDTYIVSMTIDTNRPQSVYAATEVGGVFRSNNGGGSWSSVNSGLASTFVLSLAIDPASSQSIYAGTDSGVFKSTSGGDSWSAVNSGLTGTFIRSLSIDPTNNQTIYSGTLGGGVFKSTNGATNSGYPWNAFNIWSIRTMVSSLAIDPANSQTIYAGAWNKGVFKSNNGGNSWNAVNSGLTSTDVNALAIDPTNSQIIYAGTSAGGVFKTTNGGTSWSAVNSGLTSTFVNTLAIDPANSQTIYAGAGGVFKSTNGGNSWNAVNSGLTSTDVNALAIDPTNSQIIYAGTYDGGVFKSTNGGSSWSAVNSGLTNKAVESLAIDPSNSQTIYIGTWNSGVFKSTNGGVSWRAINSGLTNLYVVSLAIDPTNSQTIYAGTYGGGVFKGFSSLDFPTINAPTPTTANVGTAYSFIPISTDAASFSITGNVPPGLIFNTATGSLSGIPSTVGIFSNLVITVTNARGSALLPAFTITVNPPMPTITGAPPATTTVGKVYSFVPTATNASSFSITNMPSWATFNTTTGALTGTPTIVDTGTFSNIIISATNGIDTVSLPAFTITVNLGTISGTPPSIAIVDTEYSFTPTATNATSFLITNKPSWANFNTATGALTGTPTIADTGTYSNIIISATNSNATVSLPAFSITVTLTMPTTTWQQTGGPTGGSVTSLIIDPTSNQTIYAGTYVGVFKSTDGGSSWSKLSNGLSSLTVQTLAIDPANSQTIYAGTLSGVFKSTNGGSSWSAMNSGLTGTYLYVYTLAIDPANSQTIYAGTYSGVFKSTNGSSSWSAMNSGLTGTFLYVNLLAIDPANSQTIYAGISNTGVFKSTNGGISWSVVNSGLTSLDVHALAIDATSSQTIYAGTYGGGTFKSSNGGITWSVLESGFTSTYIRSLAIDQTNSQTIYAGTLGSGVIKFINGGSFWGVLKNGMINTSVNTLAIDPTSGQTIYAGTNGGGVSKSINGGNSWSESSSGFGSYDIVYSLVIDPGNSQTIYAGTSKSGVLKSTNGGSSWSAVNNGLTYMNVHYLTIDPTNRLTIYAGTWGGGGVFKSTNGGSSWSEANSGLTGTNGYVYSLAIDPANSQIIYSGTYTTGVFKSTNGGSSWSAVNNGLTDLHIRSLVIDPTSSQTIYAGTYDDGVFKSTDGGSSWIAVNNGLASTYVYTLAIDPTSSQTIYAGTLGGVFKSTNGGNSWIAMNSGLTNTYAITFVIDPTNSQNIYAGTAGGGVFKGLPILVKTGSISIFPSSPILFGNVPVGGISPILTATVTNDTPGVLTILSSSGSGDISQFVFQSGGANPCPSFPATLASGQSCTISVIFSPTFAGAMETTIVINSDAANMPAFPIIIRGTGVAVTPPPTITGFNPGIGSEGTQVVITGSNFDLVAANNIVRFNGTASPAISSAGNSLTVNVPIGATTGKVSVTTPSGTATSKSDFTVDNQLPSITVSKPERDIITSQSSFILQGTASGNLSSVTISIAVDGQTYTPQLTNGNFTQSITFSSEKIYAVTVTATDEQGNKSVVQRSITYSTPDLNSDGKVDISDALLTLQMTAGFAVPTSEQLKRCDVAPIINGSPAPDGKIDIGDAVVLLKNTVGLLTW